MKNIINFIYLIKSTLASSLLLIVIVAAATLPTPTLALNEASIVPPKNIKFETTATGLINPLYLTHAGDGSGRLFIVQRDGKILIYKNGSLNSTPFLDISGIIEDTSGEQGLLGLAFDPNYETSGKFYVVYTVTGNAVTLARFTVSGDPDIANTTAAPLLSIPKTHTNHNGGMIAFGPDGYLYMAVGDGGGGGDPDDNGQDKDSLFGKILRLDVSGSGYTSPAANPFASDPNGKDEIWAYGLRNPWRFSFDRSTGDLYTGDVGQGKQEEINFQLASSTGGENYGWRIMEGNLCYNPSSNCTPPSDYEPPIHAYDHGIDDEFGCSVTGGYVYRGSNFPALQGVYLYGDFCLGEIWGLVNNGSVWTSTLLADTDFYISSFGEDESGELYVVDYVGGTVYRLVEAPILQNTYASSATNDGFILEASENSNTGSNLNTATHSLPLGDNAGKRQYRVILSFNTAGLPDNAVILSVVLKIRQKEITGTNPFNTHGQLVADIRSGAFNGHNALELADFAYSANKNSVIKFSNTPVNSWYSKGMNPLGFDHMNKIGITQFRLRFTIDDDNDAEADTLRIFSGDGEGNERPRLIVQYFIP
jgi:glucose/arabinose dehydrogenase